MISKQMRAEVGHLDQLKRTLEQWPTGPARLR